LGFLCFSWIGLNFTTAINAFIRQALRERAIQFQIRAVEPTRKILLAEGRELMKSIQEDSARNGTDKITMDEIDEEIATYRREKREKISAQL
jgi:antitoxin component of RelBE/YafQ-DinJ toxin-antitoxin module